MTREIVKEGFAQAQNEQKEKQIAEVKKIVLRTLEKKREQEKIRDEAIAKVKILNMDIEDLKEGKLDRIAERQEKDEEAKKISVVVIIKETVINNNFNPWYIPYRITWNQPYYVNDMKFGSPTISNGNTLLLQNGTTELKSVYTDNSANFVGYCDTINCSVAKASAGGTYELSNHEIAYVR